MVCCVGGCVFGLVSVLSSSGDTKKTPTLKKRKPKAKTTDSKNVTGGSQNSNPSNINRSSNDSNLVGRNNAVFSVSNDKFDGLVEKALARFGGKIKDAAAFKKALEAAAKLKGGGNLTEGFTADDLAKALKA